jgi:hypothetical protein
MEKIGECIKNFYIKNEFNEIEKKNIIKILIIQVSDEEFFIINEIFKSNMCHLEIKNINLESIFLLKEKDIKICQEGLETLKESITNHDYIYEINISCNLYLIKTEKLKKKVF